jgi:hypothetical protein
MAKRTPERTPEEQKERNALERDFFETYYEVERKKPRWMDYDKYSNAELEKWIADLNDLRAKKPRDDDDDYDYRDHLDTQDDDDNEVYRQDMIRRTNRLPNNHWKQYSHDADDQEEEPLHPWYDADEKEDFFVRHLGMGKGAKLRQGASPRAKRSLSDGKTVTVTESELKQLVGEAVANNLRRLLRESDTNSESGTNIPDAKSVVAFTKKFDQQIEKMIKEVRALADEGEKLIDPNLMNHPEGGTRNEWVIFRVGMLRTISNSLATTFERVRRYLG